MGWKSTQRLTRQDAEERYLRFRLADPDLIRSIRAEAVMMNDTALEDALERLAEQNHESGYNYLITAYPDED
ncbi:hypothetical protein HOU02_gp368 [Caulobacter phage CcrBL9]|uniref:Uncharacterized protein n=1 Tax=Caulobacter phage CcrBL9 TaxID=2283270 RepID=A0A385EEY2_9CAUD|nr:hypothetical protein HOU02_gp368 [Caulobacter phage CcrBL9]AXQ69357.1 hypothetical protein CcrBL9_gp333 [Caulobacter phage CcrBL9]